MIRLRLSVMLLPVRLLLVPLREKRKPVSLRRALITRMRPLRETPLRRMMRMLLIGEKTPPCA